MFNLLDSQRQGLTRMLELSAGKDIQWKVLVYDKHGQEIIAPLLNVGALRNLGVTLHLPLHSDRQALPEVPVVYFIDPTDENLARVVSDIDRNLYEAVYLNFTSSITKQALEMFAKNLSPPVRIQRVVDRLCAFISLSQSTFSLSLPTSYTLLHNSQASEASIGHLTDKIAEGVFCAILASRNVPIIRCAPGGASELVARKVNSRIRDFIISGGPAASEILTPSAASLGGSAQRPLLMLLDREVDLTGMLNHTWTYQALLHDVLALRGDHLRVDGKDYYIDSAGDTFFEKHAAAPFPEVATAVNDHVAEFKQKQAAIGDDKSGGLSAAVHAMPGLTDAKKRIDFHTTVATSLLSEIGKRRLDRYFEFETEVGRKSISSSLAELTELGKSGSLTDQARAIFSFLLCKSRELNQGQVDALVKQLQSNTEDLSPGVKYIRYLASVRNMADTASSGKEVVDAPAAGFVKGLISVGMQNIKNILPTKEEMPVTKQLESAMDQQPGSEKLLYFDPKTASHVDSEAVPRFKGIFRSGMVFIVGGGNYVEAQNVQAYASLSGKEIVYGATDFVSPVEFARELVVLGRSI